MTAVLAQVHEVVRAADEDLDIDPALAACVQLSLAGPHLASGSQPAAPSPMTLSAFGMGRVRVSFKAPWRSGTAHADMDAHQFLARLWRTRRNSGSYGTWAAGPGRIESAVLHGHEPWAYLSDVLIKLAAGWPLRRLAELLPDRWTPGLTPLSP